MERERAEGEDIRPSPGKALGARNTICRLHCSHVHLMPSLTFDAEKAPDGTPASAPLVLSPTSPASSLPHPTTNSYLHVSSMPQLFVDHHSDAAG